MVDGLVVGGLVGWSVAKWLVIGWSVVVELMVGGSVACGKGK